MLRSSSTPKTAKRPSNRLTALEELLAFDDEDVAPSPAPKTYAVATAKSLAAVAAGPDVHALTSLIVRATTTEKYTLDEWAGDYVIEDGEPVKKGELANQYRLTWADAAGTQSEALFTYSAGGVEYTRRGRLCDRHSAGLEPVCSKSPATKS